MNKTVAAISGQTMDSLIRYSWPGNIRELQNVIERSVVVYQKGTFSVTKIGFSGQPFQRSSVLQSLRRSTTEDRRMIASALAEAGGRVSGPSGAAALLGLPASTLESKIRSMNINKYSFKTSVRTPSRTDVEYRERFPGPHSLDYDGCETISQ
jgi:DNA-binding NtrC family response regulator